MRKIHAYWKLVVIGFVLSIHVLLGVVARVLLHGSRRRAFFIANLQRDSKIILAVLGVKLEVEGLENWKNDRTYLVVSNHMSYLDMLVFACIRPLCFVSTIEVLETPFLGQIAETSGSLFVERRSRENIKKEISEISATLQQGFNMVFFPEGTSTNGEQVLPFKRPLFAPAERTNTPVLPVVIQYESIDGEPITRGNRDLICWYGDMDFSPHLLALAGRQGAVVKVKILPEIPMGEKVTREAIASQAEAMVRENYRIIQ